MEKSKMEWKEFLIQEGDSNFTKFRKILCLGVAFIFSFTILYVLFTLISGIGNPGFLLRGKRTTGNLILIILKQLFGILVLILPYFMEKKFDFKIPDISLVLFYIFIFSALFLGEVRGFYSRFTEFDKFLHFISGMVLTMLGFHIVEIINKKGIRELNITPLFITLFAIGFALMCGNLWELYEFTMDGLFDMNLQRYREYSGTIRLGRAALMDTMTDLITNMIGSTVAGVIGYRLVKNKKK